MHFETGSRQWFVLQIRMGHEFTSVALLRSKGNEEFLPTRIARRDAGTQRVVARPLFPGYLFCRFGPDVLGPLLTTPGVIRVVGYGGRLAAIDGSELESIRKIVDARAEAASCAVVQGQKVQVQSGPLAGAEGVVVSAADGSRLVVSVSLLQTSVSVKLDGASLTRDLRRPVPVNHRASTAAA